MFEIIGILIGHLYYYVMYKYPEDNNNQRLLDTPQILHDWFPPTMARSGAATFIPPRSNAQSGARNERWHSWGRGHTLGGT